MMRVVMATLMLVAFVGETPTRYATRSYAPAFQRKQRFYVLAGKSLEEILVERRALADKGEAPVGAFGHTAWGVTFSIERGAGTKTSCAPEPVVMTVTLTTTLPKAENSSRFSKGRHGQLEHLSPSANSTRSSSR